MKIDYSNLEKKINIKFKDKKLLIKSLTHKSFDKIDNNEKIEFLGDRVLGLVIAKKLLEIYPDEKEGILDKKLASLVNKNQCIEVAKIIGLEKFILIGNRSSKTKIVNKIIADFDKGNRQILLHPFSVVTIHDRPYADVLLKLFFLWYYEE